MKRSGLDSSRLCSLCLTPVPAVMNWIEPRPRLSDVPMLSLCVREPSTMYVQISMFACPWVPKPLLGWTRSSFMTRRQP
jgi:hypothetical protein